MTRWQVWINTVNVSSARFLSFNVTLILRVRYCFVCGSFCYTNMVCYFLICIGGIMEKIAQHKPTICDECRSLRVTSKTPPLWTGTTLTQCDELVQQRPPALRCYENGGSGRHCMKIRQQSAYGILIQKNMGINQVLKFSVRLTHFGVPVPVWPFELYSAAVTIRLWLRMYRWIN